MSWENIDKSEGPEGTTITYRLEGTQILVQSRKRHIRHANGVGTWDHTSYWVINRGEEIKEFLRLRPALTYAELLAEGEAP